MTALDLVARAWADGALIAMTPTGRLRLTGDPQAVDRWLLVVKQYESELIEALQAQKGQTP